MEETIKTVPLLTENEKIISIWVGRGLNMTRVPGRTDNMIMVTHELGDGPNDWHLSIPSGTPVETLLPALVESLRRYCSERNIALSPVQTQTKTPSSAKPLVVSKSRTESIPFPKGMTPEQISEFRERINGLKPGKLVSPPEEPPK